MSEAELVTELMRIIERMARAPSQAEAQRLALKARRTVASVQRRRAN